MDCDRSSSTLERAGVKRHQIAQVHRSYEDDFVHRLRHEFFRYLPSRLNSAGKIDIAENHSTEDRAVRVRIARKHGHANCRKTVAFACAHVRNGLFRRSWPIVVDRPWPAITNVSSSKVSSFL